MSLLKLENITKRFGGLVAVDQVNLEIEHGQYIGIVGPNGSGKTTLFNIINGVLFPEEGRIFFEGQEITRMPSYKRAPMGLGRTFQIPRPFGSATVRENIAVGAMFGTLTGKINVDQALDMADKIADRMGLAAHKEKAAGDLTPIEKKLTEIARALAMKPKLLLMDEAMAGMHPNNIDQTITLIREIATEERIAMVAMVEHIMRAVIGMAEKVIVLHQGAKIVEAPTEEALSHPKVVEIYFGRSAEE